MASYTEVSICEMALYRIGIAEQFTDVDGTIAGVTDSTVEQRVCARVYAQARDRVLQSHHWTFARKFVTLVLADDGTGEIWTDEWENAYTYPSDCLKIRRFVTDVGKGWYHTSGEFSDLRFGGSTHNEWPYVVRQHAGAKVILTDVETADADIEYTCQETDTTLYDDLFVSALAYLIAAEITVPLVGEGADAKRREMLTLYGWEMQQARSLSVNEERPHDEGDGDFVRARGWH